MSGGRAVNIIQMLVQQVQYVSLLRTLPIGFPDKFRDMLSVLNFINIDPRLVIASNEIPLIDHRGMFVIVSILWPLFLSLCVLMLYVKFSIVFAYFIMLFGIVALGAGLLGRYMKGDVISGTQIGESFIIAGGVLIGIGALSIFIIRSLDTRADAKAGGHEQAESERLVFNQKFHRMRTMRHLLTTIFCGLIGLTLSGWLDYGAYTYISQSSIPIWVYLGYAFLVISFINLLYFLLHATEGGRRKFMKFQHFIQSYGLLVLLLLISTTYIPVITYALSLLMCATYSCPAGAKFNPYAMRAEGNYTRDQAIYCDTCTFLSNNCGPSNVTDLCPAFSGNRVWTNPEIPCDDAAALFFRVAAGMMLAVYSVVIPLMYFFVIRFLSTTTMELRYVGMEDHAGDLDAQWARVLPHVRPQASSLYENFTFHSRYFALYNVGQRLAVMVLLVIVAAFTEITVPLLLAVYAISLLYIWRNPPYLHNVEQWLAIALAICNVLNASLAVYLWRQGGGQTVAITAVFIVINIGLPLILSIVVIWQQKRRATAAQAAEDADSFELEEPGGLNGTLRGSVNLNNSVLDAAHPNMTPIEYITFVQKKLLRTKIRSWNKSTGDKYLGGYFMVVGTFCVLALGACVVGSLRMQAPQFLVSTDRLYQRNSVMLAGYPTWDVMNENCCCLEGAHPSETFNIQERWVCRTNKVIERGRRTRNNEEDGRPVRGVCKSEPVDSQICTIPSTENGKPYMDCGTSDELFVPDLMSEYAYDFLF